MDEKMILQGQSSRGDDKLSFLKIEDQEEFEVSQFINPEQKLWQSNIRKTRSLIMPKKMFSQFFEEIKPVEVKLACLQIVAFIEIAMENRILQADF